MTNNSKLFYPGHLDNRSQTFELIKGQQATVAAMGLVDDDYIEFEMVNTPAVSSKCMLMEEVSVTATQKIMYGGKPVRINASNPIVILDAPQGIKLRAVRHVEKEESAENLFVWLSYTQTPSALIYQGLDYGDVKVVEDFADVDYYEGAE